MRKVYHVYHQQQYSRTLLQGQNTTQSYASVSWLLQIVQKMAF